MPEPDDLWGGGFHPSDVEPAPVALLREQASLLSSKTEGRVVGDVKEHVSSDGTVWTSLYARVPALGDYEHKIISLSFPVTARDLGFPSPLTAVNTRDGDKVEFDDMGRFRDWLRTVLTSDEVRSIINKLMRYGGKATASA